MMKFLVCLVVSVTVLRISGAETAYEQACAQLVARQGNDADRLRELFRLDWDYVMVENPEFATRVGYSGQNDRWTDQSLEAIARRHRKLQAPLGVIRSVDPPRLATVDQLNYDLFKKDKEDA